MKPNHHQASRFGACARLQTSAQRGFRAALRQDGVYELLVYDDIGQNWWGEGITAKGFKQELDQAGMYTSIALRINSPGGDAFEGVAILNMLKAQGKPIFVYIDGLAASAASIIAMAGDAISMGSGAVMMIHNAWGGTVGNAADHQKQVNALNAIDGAIAQTYADRTGQKLEDVRAMMDAETWMGADDCIERGFATAKANTPPSEAARALNLARGFQALKWFDKVPPVFQADGNEEDADEECRCECEACKDGDCANCSNVDCADAHCVDCPMQETAKASIGRRWTNERAAIAALAHQAQTGWADRAIVSAAGKMEILAVRRFGSAVLNLAPAEGVSSVKAQVSGVLAPYNAASSDLGGFQEVYQPGCFNKWLAQDDPRVLFNHNIDCVLGRKSAGTARFWEEPDGLHFEADLPDTQAARDLRVSLARRDIKESSAAFYILDHAWENRSGVRTRVVKEARLVEGSPHSFAAYPNSTAQPGGEESPAQDSTADHELECYGARLQLLRIA
jgi:HK97 family phage prohead protease